MAIGGFCILFSGISMLMDLSNEKVSNRWILAGAVTALMWNLWVGGWRGGVVCMAGTLVPMGLLFPLFVARMLGTGDIKVFMVLGSMLGIPGVIRLIAGSFFLGAVEALVLLLFRRNLWERFSYFFTYLKYVMLTKTILPYLAPGKSPENIHFTVPIFVSVLLYIGGFWDQVIQFSC